jgi:N-acetylmuramidase/lysin, putative
LQKIGLLFTFLQKENPIMKKRRMMASRAEKFTRFGIRKCSLGAVSVAIATGLAFLGSGAVQAEQLTPSQTADSVAVSQAVENQASTAATPTVTETSLSSMDKAAPAPEAVTPDASQIPTSSDTSARPTSSDPVENAHPKSDTVASTENQPAVADDSEKSDASNQLAQAASATERPLAAEVKKPQGKITIQNNNPQTGEFDIVVSDIVAPDGLKAVYLPTWSSKDDQDDVQWYTAERQADGTYKKHVRAQDHKFSVGEYKVHLYYLNEDGQMQGAGGEKLMVSVAPENIRATGKINIQNNNARTGTFDVVVTNVSNPGGIQAVYLPTWSTDKDQDDVKWYLAQKQANGTYKITVRASDHKLSTGEYKIHLYYKQDNGQLIAVDATTTQVSKAVYNTPYYSQRDGRWGGRKYGPYSMDATGCVPTTLAMVISGITGTEVLPTTVADYLYNNTNEFNKDGFGTSSRGIVRAAQHWDLTTETLFTASAVKEALSQGHHVLGAVGTSIFAHYPVTHELVLKGYDNGKTYVRDPYNAANNGWYPVDYLFGVKSVDPTDNTEGSPFIAIKG